jgi:hypothetical protein
MGHIYNVDEFSFALFFFSIVWFLSFAALHGQALSMAGVE